MCPSPASLPFRGSMGDKLLIPRRSLAVTMPKMYHSGGVIMRTTTALKEILSEIEYLFSLSKDPMTIVKKAGEVLLKEGDTGSLMYVVKSGAIDIEHHGARLELKGNKHR